MKLLWPALAGALVGALGVLGALYWYLRDVFR